VTVKRAPRTTQIPPTTTYAIPRKGFLPPMTVPVLITIDLVPPYSVTLKTVHISKDQYKGRNGLTASDIELVFSLRHSSVRFLGKLAEGW
jgi:hypothetical protein